jgi:ribosomal protein S18 acetylase RimI-like enzyme
MPRQTVEGKVRIRRAVAEDYETVRDLLVHERMTDAAFFTKHKFVLAIKRFGKYNLVAEIDGKVVGYASGFDDTGIFYGYIGRLVVDQEYRRRGIGERLVSARLEEMKRAGIGVILAGVDSKNPQAKRLLRKAGFVDPGYHLLFKDLEGGY